ncbi:flotillin [bacterium]|jgi:flotillin|nr:flotillin [bacterium]
METLSNVVVGAGIGAGAVLFLLIFFAWLVRSFLRIAPPNEVLVISGKGRGYETYFGGKAWSLPIIQDVEKMSLNTMEVPITVRNAYSSGGIAMNVEAIANVKVSSDKKYINNAIERFLNRDVNEIRRVGKETLEGHLRGVISSLTPEQVNEDRLAFSEKLAQETEQDLTKLGLHLDTFKILHVSDEVGYLDATGRKAIANVIRAAEIAESDARRGAEESEAQNMGRAKVMQSNVDAKLVALQNDLRRIRADLDSKVKAEEERTIAAAREARAKAEQELQTIRAELETLRLTADKVLPAEANKISAEYRAKGEAAMIRERGVALSTALELMHGAWQEAGPNALQISLIENLESILSTASKGVQKIKIDSLNVIDSGDGQTLKNYIAAYPGMLDAVFKAVDNTVGIDIQGSISGRKEEGKS